MFIVLDGIEGAGKSTQVLHLASRLRAESGRVVRTLRDPGGTPLGEELRGIVKRGDANICGKSELLIFAAARAQLIEEVIKPALANSEIVICDRFLYSTIAYQGFGRGLAQDVSKAMDVAVGDFTPNLAFILDVSVETSNQRLKARGEAKDRIESEQAEFFEKVRLGFLLCSYRMKNVVLIDANKGESEVALDIWNKLPRPTL